MLQLKISICNPEKVLSHVRLTCYDNYIQPQVAIPASSKTKRKDDHDLTRAILPLGAIVKARIYEASNPKMQESYTARVVRAWPAVSSTSKKNSDSANETTELVALHFLIQEFKQIYQNKDQANHHLHTTWNQTM